MIKILCILTVLIMTGCASIPMASREEDQLRKQFTTPRTGQAGLYIYRNAIFFGDGITREIKLDRNTIGRLPVRTFCYLSVNAGSHILSTESSISDNDITLTLEDGKNYFINQYITPGAPFMGAAAHLEVVSEEAARQNILEYELIASPSL